MKKHEEDNHNLANLFSIYSSNGTESDIYFESFVKNLR